MSIALDAPVAERAAYLRESGIWAALSEPALHAVAARDAAGRLPDRRVHHPPGGTGPPSARADAGRGGRPRPHAGGTVINVTRCHPVPASARCRCLSGDATSADVVARRALRRRSRSIARRSKRWSPASRSCCASSSGWSRGGCATRTWPWGRRREKEKGLTRFLQDARAEQYGELVGATPAMRALQRQIEAQAALDGPS